MTMKTKLVLAAGVLLALSVAFACWLESGTATQPALAARAPALVAADLVSGAKEAPPVVPQREVVASAASRAASTGSLIVHVRYGDDQAPAADLTVIVARKGGGWRLDGRRVCTDSTGTARIDALLPGAVRIQSNHFSGSSKLAEIRAGETTDIDLLLPIGLTVTGVVVDGAGVPVPGAVVEMVPVAMSGADAEAVATTDAVGRFVLRSCFSLCLLGARAEGHAASRLRMLMGKDGGKAEVRLELTDSGGAVDGVVVGPDGQAVANAVVRIGRGRMETIEGPDRAPPLPAQVRTDAHGRFHAFGVPLGEQPVMVRAVGLAPWIGTCKVAANLTTMLRIALTSGATCIGTVRSGAGDPAANATLQVGRRDAWLGERDDFLHHRARTAADGSFRLEGLSAGEIEIDVVHAEWGNATAVVQTQAGATVARDISLSRGLELRGRVIDDADAPVLGAHLALWALLSDGKHWSAAATTDERGAFVAANCPEGKKLSADVSARGFESKRVERLDPRAGEVVVRLERAAKRSVRIVGRVVGPDGGALPNANVSLMRRNPSGSSGINPTGSDGRFELGPVVPGSWKVRVHSTDLTDFQSEWRELTEGATWDLGLIRLGEGGRVVVRPIGEAAGVRFLVVDAAHTRLYGVDAENACRDVLAPGRYCVVASGKGIAAQGVPFEIKAGVVTQVEVHLAPGIRQRVELVSARELPSGASIRVQRDGALVASEWFSTRDGEPFGGELWLAPGTYSLTAIAFEATGQASFVVADRESALLRVELR